MSHIRYTISRSGTQYYSRRVPSHAFAAYGTHIRQALSSCPLEAESYATRLSNVLEASWDSHKTTTPINIPAVVDSFKPKSYLLSEMAEEYLSLRKIDAAPPKLALETFIRLAGDRDVVSYTRDDAKLFVDALLTQGNKTATIRRRIRLRPDVLLLQLLEGQQHPHLKSLLLRLLLTDEVVAEEETTEDEVVSEEELTTEEEVVAEYDVQEDIDALIAGEELSEEFQEKARTIFEAAINAKVAQIKEQLEAENAQKFAEEVAAAKESLAERVDSYLEYVSDEWFEENALAVEAGLKTEMTESFLSGMKGLFEEHYVTIPEEKYDVLESMVEKLDDMETKLNEQIEKNITLNARLSESAAEGILNDVSEGLASTQKEKLASLAESVEFESEAQRDQSLWNAY